MNTVLIICTVIVTIAVLVAAVFLVITLLQIFRATKEAEMLIRNMNNEMCSLVKITGSISNLFNSFSSPWVKFGSLFTGVVSSIIKKRKTERNIHAEDVNQRDKGRENV